MGISDWSSDVCSSDLVTAHALVKARETGAASLEPVIQEKGHGLVRAIGRGLGRVVDFAVIPAAGDTEVEAFDHIAGIGERDAYQEIGRAHVCTPVTNAHLVCRLLLQKIKSQHDGSQT